MQNIIHGISASPGIAMGRVKRFVKEKMVIDHTKIHPEQVHDEVIRAKNAFDAYASELKKQTEEIASETQKEVILAHQELLGDPYYFETVSSGISEELQSAEWAIDDTTANMASMMESLDDPYLRERGADYRDIGANLLQILKGVSGLSLADLSEPVIVVAEELAPSDTAEMKREYVLAFANDLGGATSHTSIIAQTLGIPCLVGMKTISQQVKDGDFIIVDANQGMVFLDPDEETRHQYESKLNAQKAEEARLKSIQFEAAMTSDGRKIEMVTNIGNLGDLDLGLAQGAEGVGLFRTEFLYMDNTHFPTEEEQFLVYREAAERLGEKPLVIRTLDIGGDKSLPYYEFPKEDNPFLGWRALRFCFDREDVFRTQLRALLRASAFGNLKILLPMIVSVDELIRVQQMLSEEREKLDAEHIAYRQNMQVGVMIETPASVFSAHALAEHCDFFSIGTNDLTQYILAADRGNEKVARIYNSFNPAVLRAISLVIQEAHSAGIWCGMCGGFAGDPRATRMLLGMGLDEFSVPAAKIAQLKDIIRSTAYSDAQEEARAILGLATVNDVMAYEAIHEQSSKQ